MVHPNPAYIAPILRATCGAESPTPAAPIVEAMTAPPAAVPKKPVMPVAAAAEPPANTLNLYGDMACQTADGEQLPYL